MLDGEMARIKEEEQIKKEKILKEIAELKKAEEEYKKAQQD